MDTSILASRCGEPELPVNSTPRGSKLDKEVSVLNKQRYSLDGADPTALVICGTGKAGISSIDRAWHPEKKNWRWKKTNGLHSDTCMVLLSAMHDKMVHFLDNVFSALSTSCSISTGGRLTFTCGTPGSMQPRQEHVKE